MKAVVYHGPKHVRVDEVPDPRVENPGDILVRVTSTAICGSDLHIYNGLLPRFKKMILGHEFMGVVEETGSEVRKIRKGDRVVVPATIAEGHCWFCLHGLPAQCEKTNPNYGPEGGLKKQKGGALYGETSLYGGYAGGQAQRVRVPYADYSARKVPEALQDEQVLFLSDILPAGWAALEWAGMQAGETVAVFGCGPVGLMAQKAARLKGAARVIGIDVVPARLALAERVAGSETLDARRTDVVDIIRGLTSGRGADVCVDAVGMEPRRNMMEKVNAALRLQRGTLKVLRQAIRAVRRGGTVSILGQYSTSYDSFPLNQLWDKGVTLRMGQAPVQAYIDPLLSMIQKNKLRADDIITHVMPLGDAPKAYHLFNKRKDLCVKVVLKP